MTEPPTSEPGSEGQDDDREEQGQNYDDLTQDEVERDSESESEGQ